jgi:hypothetical protein
VRSPPQIADHDGHDLNTLHNSVSDLAKRDGDAAWFRSIWATVDLRAPRFVWDATPLPGHRNMAQVIAGERRP